MLTDIEWNAVKNQSDKIQDLYSSVNHLQNIFTALLTFADPANNPDMTMIKLKEMYLSKYTNSKADILSKLNSLT